MKKKLYVLLAFIILLGQQAVAYDPRYSSFDEEWLRGVVEEIVPEGWQNYWIQVEQLDPHSSKEYVLTNFQRRDPDLKSDSESAIQNQLVVFEVIEEELQPVWKSDFFYGNVKNFEFEDADNNGRKNINAYIAIEEEGKRVGRIRMYDWNGSNTLKVYPEDHLMAIDCRGMRYYDYDKDGDTELVIRKDNKDHYYLFKNGQIVLKKVQEIKIPPGFASEKPLGVEYPEIIKIANEKGYANISEIMEYNNSTIFLVVAEYEEGEVYLIFGKDSDEYAFWYTLDEQLSSLHCSNWDDDLNMDGYFDLVLEDYTGMSEPVCLYYIVTLKPTGYQIISPINDNFYSGMWVYIKQTPMEFGTYGLMTHTYYKEQLATQYWSWDTVNQCFIPHKIEYYDAETDQYIMVDEF